PCSRSSAPAASALWPRCARAAPRPRGASSRGSDMSNVIEAAAGRRREVLAALSTANGAEDAATAVSHLLAVSTDEAREVLRAPLEAFAGGSAAPRGASEAAGGFALHPFRDSEEHRALFHSRSSDASSATGGEWDEERTEKERREGLSRIESETAMWFVAVDTARDA